MTFKKLAQYFLELEKTSSRNSMVEILSRLFQEADENEIDKVVYLTQGRVAPLYEPVEFQMAEKMVIRAIVAAYNKTADQVTKLYKESGDLGVTAEKMNLESGILNLGVNEVFSRLTEITKINGEGSVEKKVILLAEILKDCDPVSARIIARIPVNKLRLGFSDMTVLEALSWMICGTKKLKDELEANYNVRPDLGVIAKQAKIQDSRFKIQPLVGTPVLGMRAERLTSPAEILEKMGGKCAVEPKLDGLRTQLHFKNLGSKNPKYKILDSRFSIQLYSRGLENVTHMYPDLVEAAKKELACEEIMLDGEAIGFDPATGKYLPFQETVQRKRKHEIGLFAENVPLKLIVFDVLFLDGKSLISEPYESRRKILLSVIASEARQSSKKKIASSQAPCNDNKVVPADMRVINKSEDLNNYFEECVKKGLEGIMVKKLDGVYQAGARGWNWIKYKASYASDLVDTIDAVVMGIDFGQGKRNKFGVGAFLIGVFDPKSQTYKTISKVGTGLTDEEWRALAASGKGLGVGEKPNEYEVNKLNNCDLWFRPEMVGEFKGDELTKSPMHTAGYALRFPRLVRWREKKPEDTTSLQEIVKLVNLNKEKEGDKNEN